MNPLESFTGRFFDGVTAKPISAIVSVSADALVIKRADYRTETWPLAQVARVCDETPHDPLRLRFGAARLSVDRSDFKDFIFERAPHLAPPSPAKRLLTVVLLVGVMVLVAPLLWHAWRHMTDWTLALIPPEKEVALGAAFVEDVGGDKCYAAEGQAALDKMVTSLLVGQAVLNASSGKSTHNTTLPYAVKAFVTMDPSVNAVALPGGYILIYQGLLEFVHSPEELAGVMAHEMVHLRERHNTAGWVRGVLLSTVVMAVTGQSLDVAQFLVKSNYSQQDEAAADQGGVEILNAARVGSQGFYQVMKRLGEDDHGTRILKYLRDHPETSKRVEMIGAQAQPAQTSLLDAQEWQSLKQICAAQNRAELVEKMQKSVRLQNRQRGR